MKSRAGKAISECGAGGGSLATTALAAGDDCSDRLAAESAASTVYR
jgi:hypothetical protein